RGRGPVATVLVQEGTLRPGDAFVCGTQYGRVRAMMNDKGQRIEAAGPSTPLEILGLGGVPEAGDTFVGVQDDQKARQVAEHRRTKQREAEMAKTAKVSLDELYQQIQTGQVKELKVVLKADVQGSVEATSEALRALSSGEVRLTFTVSGIGQVAGCFVAEGKIPRGTEARLLRDHVVVHDGRIASLKRFKEDVREVAGGYECGMSLDGYQDMKVGDVIEAYEVEQVARRLAPAAAKGAQAAERTA